MEYYRKELKTGTMRPWRVIDNQTGKQLAAFNKEIQADKSIQLRTNDRIKLEKKKNEGILPKPKRKFKRRLKA